MYVYLTLYILQAVHLPLVICLAFSVGKTQVPTIFTMGSSLHKQQGFEAGRSGGILRLSEPRVSFKPTTSQRGLHIKRVQIGFDSMAYLSLLAIAVHFIPNEGGLI